jgi:hypothetical protein
MRSNVSVAGVLAVLAGCGAPRSHPGVCGGPRVCPEARAPESCAADVEPRRIADLLSSAADLEGRQVSVEGEVAPILVCKQAGCDRCRGDLAIADSRDQLGRIDGAYAFLAGSGLSCSGDPKNLCCGVTAVGRVVASGTVRVHGKAVTLEDATLCVRGAVR